MAIPAKRFKFLDEETNVGISDFVKSTSSDLLNSANNEIKEVSSNLEGFLNNAKQSLSSTESFKDASLRAVKGASSVIKDITKATPKDIDKMIAETLPGNAMVQSAFNQLSSACKTQALGFGGLGKPWNPIIDCNGSKRTTSSSSCNNGQFGDVLNKLTGGEYSSKFTDLNRTLKNLMALASYGLKMNMCGVFGALSKNLDLSIISRAAGGLLSEIGAAGNVLGFMDIAKSSIGSFPLLENPSGITGIFNNFKLPSDLSERGLSEFADRFTGSAELLNPNWTKSVHDGMLSTSVIGKYTPKLDTLMTGKMMDNVFTESSLNTIHSDESTLMTVAQKTYKSATDGLRNLMPGLSFARIS